jgi:hypothetical protein
MILPIGWILQPKIAQNRQTIEIEPAKKYNQRQSQQRQINDLGQIKI